jgi:hypothetical protein
MSKKPTKSFAEEYRERLNREDLERRWKLEALDLLFTESDDDPDRFERFWIKPLLAAGLNLESALNLIVEARFHPN